MGKSVFIGGYMVRRGTIAISPPSCSMKWFLEGLNLLFEFLQLVSIEQLIPSYVYQNLNTSIKLEQRL